MQPCGLTTTPCIVLHQVKGGMSREMKVELKAEAKVGGPHFTTFSRAYLWSVRLTHNPTSLLRPRFASPERSSSGASLPAPRSASSSSSAA